MTNLSPLLPERHPETDMFLCDISDAVIKDDMATMEHPIFVLPKKPYMNIKRYEHGSDWFEVHPSSKGIANIWDKDLLIFATSQIMAAKNAGKPYSKHVSFVAHDFLIFTNRGTGGKDYEALKDSLTRLKGTMLQTNIKSGNEEITKGFDIIDSFTIRKEHLDGRVLEWGITISDWLFNAIESNEVLTLNPDYFRLRKPLERRVYEIARKHCGKKKDWAINIDLLHKKSGSSANKDKFKEMLKNIEEHQHLPDYQVAVDDSLVTFYRTGQVGTDDNRTKQSGFNYTEIPPLSSSTLEKAGNMCRKKGLDKYALEYEWREWATGKTAPSNGYDAAFLGYVKMKLEQS